MSFRILRRTVFLAASAQLLAAHFAFAGEHITLRNGSVFDCVRHEISGERVRLFLLPSTPGDQPGTVEVKLVEIAGIETFADPLPAAAAAPAPPAPAAATARPTARELTEMLHRAGSAYNIDAELLASVVHAESSGNPQAVSRTGARGLMQLMPSTAAELGIHDAFLPDRNVDGGTRYLNALLTRYHDNIALALAAYNAGPAAVDKYHGVPPFRETRAYVARVIREFNRRKTLLLASATPGPHK